MRKLLSLMSLLAVSTTTATSVVACSNANQNLSFDFSKSVNTLQDGTINVLGKTIDPKATTLPDGIVNDIKGAIVTRLQVSSVQNAFGNLKASDFKLTLETTTASLPLVVYIADDKINADKNISTAFLESIKNGATNEYIFKLTPNKGTAVTFHNTLDVRDYIATTPEKLLDDYKTKPIHVFVSPSTIKTTEDFKQVFWNGILGEPGSYNKQKGNFDATISKEDLATITNLSADNNAKASVSVTFKITKDFKTTQTGFTFSAKDKAATATVNFQTKLPTFDFSQVKGIKEALQKDKFNFEVNKGTAILDEVVTLVKTEIIKQANVLATKEGFTILTANDFKISVQGSTTDLPLIPFVTNDTVNTDNKIQTVFLANIFKNAKPDALNFVVTPTTGTAINFSNTLSITEKTK